MAIAPHHTPAYPGLADTVDDAVIATDDRFVLTGWNEGAHRMYGWSPDEVIGRHVTDVFHPVMDDALRLEVQRRTAAEGRSRVEVVSHRKDGTPMDVAIVNVAVRGPDGAVSGYYGIHRDLSEHRRTAAALREAEERVAEILDRVTDAFYALDPEWRFTYLNDRALRYLSRAAGREFARDALLGRTLWETLPALAGTPIQDRYGRALREQRAAVFEYTPPGGGPTYLIQAYPSTHGLSVYFRDITTRKTAEEDRATRARQQALVAELGLRALGSRDLQVVMDDAVAVVAQTLRVPLVAVAEIASPSEHLVLRAGLGWEEGAIGRLTAAAGHGSLVGYTVMAGRPVVSEDVGADERFEISAALAARHPVSAVTVVVAGLDGPFGALGAFAGERRWFSESDVSFVQAVANVLAAAVERSATAARLEEVRESERRRIARDLHDQALHDLAYALAEATSEASTADPAASRTSLDRVAPALRRVGEQLRAAIYDLRLGTDEDRPFGELVEALVAMHRGMADASPVVLELDARLPAKPLGAVGIEIVRILGEVLNNARRHAGAGEVRVRAWAPAGRVCAEVHSGSAPVAADIVGMRERAAMIGADLDILSPPGGGTTVRVEVRGDTDRTRGAEPVRVLLVEDHAAFREAVATAFGHEAGFEIAGQASTLAEARSLLEGVDVAIVDLGLPDGYGADLVSDLRRANPRAQALVLSATLDRLDVARAVESGAAAVLSKTVPFADVVHAVRSLRAGETLIPVQESADLLRFAGLQRRREEIDRAAIEQLTPRERDVLRLLAEGLNSQQIADALFISLRTERNHVNNILSKLGVHSQLQALVFALRYGLVEAPARFSRRE
jgi:PAS domain S-box-containing protein